MHIPNSETKTMPIREALHSDIPQLQIIRNAVLENRLSDPGRVRDVDYEPFLSDLGKGWVCEIDAQIVGFAIIDLSGSNVWALFLDPRFERQGIGRQLHDVMLNWYFSKTRSTIWLSTAPQTRAATFYRAAGWTEKGMQGAEIRFEMDFEAWMSRRINAQC